MTFTIVKTCAARGRRTKAPEQMANTSQQLTFCYHFFLFFFQFFILLPKRTRKKTKNVVYGHEVVGVIKTGATVISGQLYRIISLIYKVLTWNLYFVNIILFRTKLANETHDI